MKINKFAAVLPELSAERYEGLKKSIQDNGQLVPIIVCNDEILDGRHRFKACQELGIDYNFERKNNLTEDEQCQFVKAMEQRRDYHTPGQRALVFAELDKMFMGKAREKSASVEKGGDRKSEEYQKSTVATLQPLIKETARVNVAAATEANVSPRTMADAIKVSEHATDELKDVVKDGSLSVNIAAKAADMPEEVQAEIVELAKTLDKPNQEIIKTIDIENNVIPELKAAVKEELTKDEAHELSKVDIIEQQIIAALPTQKEQIEEVKKQLAKMATPKISKYELNAADPLKTPQPLKPIILTPSEQSARVISMFESMAKMDAETVIANFFPYSIPRLKENLEPAYIFVKRIYEVMSK